MKYNEDDSVLKVQNFLSKKGFHVDQGDNQAYRELKYALQFYIYHKQDEAMDSAIFYLLKRGWSFKGLNGFKQFHQAAMLYKRLERNKALVMVKRLGS